MVYLFCKSRETHNALESVVDGIKHVAELFRMKVVVVVSSCRYLVLSVRFAQVEEQMIHGDD